MLYPERGYWRPVTRADCARVPRPCPYVLCKHHLYLDIQPSGSLHFTRADLEPWELEHSCALDVAEGGASTYDELSEYLGVSGERLRQITDRALAKLGTNGTAVHLRQLWGLDLDKPRPRKPKRIRRRKRTRKVAT